MPRAPIAMLARIGIQVRIRRNALGLSREQLAARSNVEPGLIAVTEGQGREVRSLSALALLRLASGLQVHPAWLFTAPEAGSDTAEQLKLKLLDHFQSMSPCLQAGLLEIAETLANPAEAV